MQCSGGMVLTTCDFRGGCHRIIAFVRILLRDILRKKQEVDDVIRWGLSL